jgi:hypothetical protein
MQRRTSGYIPTTTSPVFLVSDELFVTTFNEATTYTTDHSMMMQYMFMMFYKYDNVSIKLETLNPTNYYYYVNMDAEHVVENKFILNYIQQILIILKMNY